MRADEKDNAPHPFVPALGFGFLTPLYDVVVGATTRERRFKNALVAQAALEPGQRVLDLACGTGTLALMLAASCPGAHIRGIDGDPAMLARARRKGASAGAGIQWDEGLSFALPYADGSFDCITCSLFFHHLTHADKERTLAELYRVAAPHGRLHIADWGAPSGLLMRCAFFGVQLIDGFATTADSLAGRMPALLGQARFVEVEETAAFDTMFGTLRIWRALRPA